MRDTNVDVVAPQILVGHARGIVSVRIHMPSFGQGTAALMTPRHARVLAAAILNAARECDGRRGGWLVRVLHRVIGGRRV